MSGNLRKYSEELEGEPFFTNNGILNNLQRLNNEREFKINKKMAKIDPDIQEYFD